MSKEIPEKLIAAALRKWGGIPALAAKEVNTSRQNIYQRVKNSKKLQEVVRDIEDETLDLGEGHVVKGVRDGDKDYVKYYMERKGKRRGYGPKVENSFDDTQIEALVASCGGNVKLYRAFLIRLGVNPDEI